MKILMPCNGIARRSGVRFRWTRAGLFYDSVWGNQLFEYCEDCRLQTSQSHLTFCHHIFTPLTESVLEPAKPPKRPPPPSENKKDMTAQLVQYMSFLVSLKNIALVFSQTNGSAQALPLSLVPPSGGARRVRL